MKTKHKRGSVARVIHWVWFPALLGAAALAWSFGPHDFYDGGDGKWTQSLIRFYLNFVPPFHINALNPIEADFSQLYPFNLWLHPVNIQFTFLPFEVAMNSSMLTFLAVQALAMYTCARQLGIDRISAAIAAQCAIWFFPHFTYFAGVLPIYQLNPVGSVTISLFILLLVMPLQVGPSSSLRRVAATGLVATALIAYIVYNDPMTMGLLGFCMSPAFAVVILAPSNIRGIAARLAVFAIPACILGAAGIVHYIMALDYYTYRYFFSTEVPRVQAPNFVSILFFQKSSTITLASCALGLVLGVICTRGPALVAVAMGLITMVIVAVAGTIYLFSEFHWWLPLPMYIEHYSFAFILIGVVAGYSGFLQWLGRRYGAAWRPAAAAVPVITVLAVSVLPLAIVYVGITKVTPTREPYADEAATSELFEQELGLVPTGQWNGSVYIAHSDYRQQLTIFSLWKHGIPTFNENSQTASPVFHFMAAKIMKVVLPRNSPNGRDLRHYASVGIRYLMLPSERGDNAVLDSNPEVRDTASAHYLAAYGVDSNPRLRRVFFAPGLGYGDFAWLVYELPEPNLGQYSPTSVKIAADANEYRRLLTETHFDWRRHVILESDPGTLTAADETKFYVESGRIRVDAKNAGGLSLALLPIQYSHCLRVSGTGNPRLVRSNIFFAGLLFSGESRVWIDFDFGFMKSKCRWSDIADIKQLKMAETVDEPAPEHHPFAVKKLSDLPLRLEQVLGVYRNLP